MRDVKLKKYLKKLPYSYSLGTHPTIDLLKFKSDKVLKILLKSNGLESEGVREIINLCKEKNIKYEVQDRAIDKISVKENTFAIGIFEKYEEDLEKTSNHIVLDRPRNMGNIGTIVRTMCGFGFSDLAIIRPAADIFDPMIIRSAMGALFQTRFKYFENIQEYLKEYPNHTQYMFMLDGADEVGDVEFVFPFSLVFGNESEGLPDSYSTLGRGVKIVHSNNIDSLNLGIAAGISMYVSSRQKV